MELIDKIKIELTLLDQSQDDYLALKIQEAYVDIDMYTNGNLLNIPTAIVESVASKLVIERYNKRGMEGLNYFAEGGSSYTTAEKSALQVLYNYRRPRLVAIREDSNDY